ncbi:LysE family translocator [Marivibrio halodurans]|uniref:LysE family translocator n=1 Tax=Marivibrio halodurans TaxID=2039722 RepID=A0A8J7V0Z0_9PROT|nr:LysE family translocator [Marivibrio halodurans]MBP5855780.1 LysE family translocator [Marivibrio halodurans]
MSPEFLLTAFIVVIAPGTGVLYTLACGLRGGAGAASIAALGCTLGIVPHLLAAMFGLAAILETSAIAYETLRVLGVCYLLYLAWSMLRAHGALSVEAAGTVPPAREIVVRAILVNLLNPKLSVFFLAFLPQFVTPGQPHALEHMAAMSLVFMAMTFVVFVGYGAAAGAMRDHVVSRPSVMAWLRRAFAAAFIGLGVKLALTER